MWAYSDFLWVWVLYRFISLDETCLFNLFEQQAPWNAQLGKTSYHTGEECEVIQLVAWKAKILLKTLSAGLHGSLLAWSHVPIKYKTMTATLLPTQWLLSDLKELVHCSKKYLNEQNTTYYTTKKTDYNK